MHDGHRSGFRISIQYKISPGKVHIAGFGIYGAKIFCLRCLGAGYLVNKREEVMLIMVYITFDH